MAEQLTFDLPVRTALGREDFFVSDANALAVARLDAPDAWPSGKLVLTGPEGAGKTHLAHVWASTNQAVILTASDLAMTEPGALDKPLVIEDADRLPEAAEERLFHIHNVARERRLFLLLTARTPPARWNVSLADLRSRMEATDVALIDAPDDALLAAMLVKLFTDRQLQIDPDLVHWLVGRMERSFAAAQTVVAALDAAALKDQRRISRALAQGVLDKLPG
jgi:chromosomal replication initiation ATPase DnaA